MVVFRIVRRFGNFKIVVYGLLCRNAYGIISRTKKGRNHFLILDFDGKKPDLRKIPKVEYFYKTKHGWHVITSQVVSFRKFVKLALDLGADPKWVGIGLKRGYWFIEIKDKNVLRKLLRDGRYRFMRIERAD
ncbi:MAG: hypothetical protein QXE51_04070 [Nitrososphaeria archaeon]